MQTNLLDLRFNESLSRYTTFGVGGRAEVFLEARNHSHLIDIIRYINEEGLTLHILGKGSNLLVSDEGVSGAVLHLSGKGARAEVISSEIIAFSGVGLARVCSMAADAGLSGLEFAAGIPGSLGGAVAMNAGAFGGDMSQVVAWVEILDASGSIQRIKRDDIKFRYRGTSLGDAGQIIVSAGLRLVFSSPDKIKEKMRIILEKRREKFPEMSRTAGSIWKNPASDVAAGKLIEDAGLKGRRSGNAEISPKHANFIVNLGGARAADIIDLMRQTRLEVEKKSGVSLKPEIKMWGFSEEVFN